MIKHSLETAAACPAAFRSTLVVEWYGRNPGSPDWVEAGSGVNFDFNGNIDWHEDLGVLLAVAERFGVSFSHDDVSPMARRWANNTDILFGAVNGTKVVYGMTFGLQWRVSVR